ncbi:MAG TPA: enoyl-CoA hydratase [Polyangiaceae bacterium]
MEEPVLLEQRSGTVVRLTLNRPKSKNSLDPELVSRLGDALDTVAADTTVRAIVLTGSGGAFCSGIDLKSAAADLQEPKWLEARLRAFHRLIRTIVRAPQPVVAAVDGPAVGFGADLALACDLRVASTAAYFEEKFVALGLMPDGGGTFHLPRLIGLGRALEHLLLGTRLDASTALAQGLVNRVVPADALDAEVETIVQRLALSPPLALAAIKRAVRASLEGSLEDALSREFAGQLALLASEDVREGVSAFLERRAPSFRGR